MTLNIAENAAFDALVARFEQVTGKPCHPLARSVLSAAAREMVKGHCISLRPDGDGVVIDRLKRPSIAKWCENKLAKPWGFSPGGLI